MRQPYIRLLEAIEAAGLAPLINAANPRVAEEQELTSTADTSLNAAVQRQLHWLAARTAECVSGRWLEEGAPGQFSLLGLDFMLDQQGRFCLLEVTKGSFPAFAAARARKWLLIDTT